WTVLLDELALGIARAAHERPEAAALAHQRALAALGADLTGPGLGWRLVTGNGPRLLVLRILRAGQEPAVAAELDDHRVAERADLVSGLGRRRLGVLVDIDLEL